MIFFARSSQIFGLLNISETKLMDEIMINDHVPRIISLICWFSNILDKYYSEGKVPSEVFHQ